VTERDEITRQWRRGEERLYPVVTVRPDLYEACIRIVRALADHLGAVPDLDALVTSYRATGPEEDLAAAGVEAGEVPPEVDLGMVRDAAYQFRARELEARERVERTRRLIERGRGSGEATVTIWSEGEQELWPPYRRVEMSLRTGFAVSAFTEIDPERLVPRFAVEALQLDPDTGEALDEPPLSPREEFADPDAWREAIGRLRRAVLTP